MATGSIGTQGPDRCMCWGGMDGQARPLTPLIGAPDNARPPSGFRLPLAPSSGCMAMEGDQCGCSSAA